MVTMKRDAKWFGSALTMAFLAIVALFVSPALASNCCCYAPPAAKATFSSSVRSHHVAPAQSGDSCCEDERASVKSAASHSQSDKISHVSCVKNRCACSHLDAPVFVSSDSASHLLSFPAAIAPRVAPFALSFEEDARLAPCFDAASRPRSPSWRSLSGRAPPVASL